MNMLKQIYKNIINTIDYSISILYAHIYKANVNKNEKCAVLIPAADINGGFGEDVMVAGFINACPIPITVCAKRIMPRSFLQNPKVKCIEFRQKKFLYYSLVKILMKHTDLYIIGADILDGVYKNNVIRFHILEIAHVLGIHCHITGFSVREQSSEYFLKKIREVASFVSIKARDSESYLRLCKILKEDSVEETVDIAFASGSPPKFIIEESVQKWINHERLSQRFIIAYCPNTIHANKLGLEKYIESQIKLIEEFVKHNCSILLLYHDLRTYALNMCDKDLSLLISKKIKEHALYVDGISNGIDVKNFINISDFTVTGRMHFGISGYTLGKPMFGISYYGKFDGLQSQFGLDKNASLIEYTNINKELNKVVDFVKDIALYKRVVQERMSYVIEKAKGNI